MPQPRLGGPAPLSCVHPTARGLAVFDRRGVDRRDLTGGILTGVGFDRRGLTGQLLEPPPACQKRSASDTPSCLPLRHRFAADGRAASVGHSECNAGCHAAQGRAATGRPTLSVTFEGHEGGITRSVTPSASLSAMLPKGGLPLGRHV